MERTILHSDINSCYANIELLYHPELRGVPLAVGGDVEARHGIILAKDELAKKAGVKTGMALWQARQLCPKINILPPRMDLYLRFSRLINKIYDDYTDQIERFGIDESWLDVTHSGTLGTGESIAEEIRQRVKFELVVTVSIGVSWNKIFAKLGSDYKKPDAVTVIRKDSYQDIVWPLPVDDLLFVGRATGRKLHSVGVHTIGQLAAMSPDYLNRKFGKIGYMLHAFANGADNSPVSRENEEPIIKSIGNSTTTPRDLTCDTDAYIVFLTLAESVGARMRENGFKGNVIEISVRDNELSWFTRQKKLASPTDITSQILGHAIELFRSNYRWQKPIRSLGIRASSLVPASCCEQLDLFTNNAIRNSQRLLDAAVDDVRRRFGYASIQRGTALMDCRLGSLNAREDHVVHPVGFL